ncbi:fatty acyl-AMP ligase, partial [Shimia sp.]|uniref:fatty acyl-AMP ligase n=1 Tax=Shimia sp. TaxID=1954381 RepID=UPI00356A0A36
QMIRDRFQHDTETVIVGWIPMFHDMGLIGNMMQPSYVGCRCVLMSPGAFLQEPVRWLRAISKYRGTTAGAPNFAFDLCVDRIAPEARAGLDLSSWDVAFNGSEPVRPRTIKRFNESFSPQGLRPESCYPCYGMAESTLMITGPDKLTLPVLRQMPGHRPGDPLRAVSVGRTDAAHEVRIVDPETRRALAEGEVGEIWFHGPTVGMGYWRHENETEAHFNARLAGEPGSETKRYLRTGDLGFLDAGNLFVTGRIKDVLILNGKNHYPQDVEAAAQSSHPALRANCAAAFLVDDGDQERLVVAIEVSRSAQRDLDTPAIARAIRLSVSRALGLPVSAVALLRQSSIPKTSSGKIQRQRCRELYLSDGLIVVGEDVRVQPPGAGPL